MNEGRKAAIARLLKEGVLVSPEILEDLDKIEQLTTLPDVAVINKDILEADIAINLGEMEKTKARAEKNRDNSAYDAFKNHDGPQQEEKNSNVKVVFSYDRPPIKRTPKDFVSLFSKRFYQLERILKARPELKNIVSIGRLNLNGAKEAVCIIGMVMEKQITKNGNVAMTLEDPTGTVKIIVTKKRPVLYKQAKDTVLDSVIGLIGSTAERVIFANTIMWPEVPTDNQLTKSPESGFAAIISDIHVGSTKFMPEEFDRFIKWLNGETGSAAQRELAKQVKYLFIVGDIVDGVGVYPDQKKELAITDIYEQYAEAARLLSKIPKKIRMIICPGNHDAMRLSEPQPPFIEDFCKVLRESLPHAIFVSNPSLVNIDESENFKGIDVLLYHGYSFDYYVAEVSSIRVDGGYDRADLIMKFLLQQRHLAPSYNSTLHIPDAQKDYLVIEKVPDVFASGHIHKTSVSTYRNVTLICGSCWQGKTSFQEKMGHNPEPARVPLINLRTREVKVLKFG
ncbi:MAG: DNA-directed DNA polymerase II small subunit [Nanoarchaeota archaeon]